MSTDDLAATTRADVEPDEATAASSSLPTRSFAADIDKKGRSFSAGTFTDYTCDEVRRAVYEAKQAEPDLTNKKLRRRFGLQQPVHAARAIRAWELRLNGVPTIDGERASGVSEFFDDPIGPAIREIVFWMEGGHCAKCRRRLAPSPGLSTSFHVDHIVPQSWGVADHSVANLQPLCRTCNLLKSGTEDLDYRTEGTRLGLGGFGESS